MIKGIEIESNGSQEIKLSQYADDTKALLSDSESVMQLFELLGLFERCSGLKINESKSELLWLGSWRHRKDKILNLQISEEPVYALGVHFAYERDTVLQRNFWDKLISLKKLLNIYMVSKGHFCLRQNKSSEIPRALQTGIYLQCNGNSKTFC